MKFIKYLAVFFLLFSSLVIAEDTVISAEKITLSNNNSKITYVGDVKIAFGLNEVPSFTSDQMQIKDNIKTFEGNVVFSIQDSIARADKVVVLENNNGLVAITDRMSLESN